MQLLKTLGVIIIFFYFILQIVLYALQGRLIFYPGKLRKDFKYKPEYNGQETFIETADGEQINALFYKGNKREVILYFHGNAGDLSGWQFVSEDFTVAGYYLLLIDYRGYGKSSGTISENGFYQDAAAAYAYLIERGFVPDDIIIYGRSIGSGIAVELASQKPCKGLVLESPYASLPKLANEKLPFFFPSLYLKFKFNNQEKINKVFCPVIFLHGMKDELIPASHTERLFKTFTGKKKKILIVNGSHNDLNSFPEYHQALQKDMSDFFALQ